MGAMKNDAPQLRDYIRRLTDGSVSLEHARGLVKEWAEQDRVEYEASVARAEKDRRSCNRHDDCAAANERAKEAGRLGADHCHDDCCEECFGN